ncbi:MAG: hypothetical protein AAF497_09020, partial [Planctomycetota bacterium]
MSHQHDSQKARTRRKSSRRRKLSCEFLESRRLLATIRWDNLGAGDGLDAIYGDEATAARNVMFQAAIKWEQVIEDFNFDEAPDQDFDVILTLDARDNVDCSAAASVSATTDNGTKATAGDVRLNFCDSDGDGNTEWWFDPTPADNSEFLGDIVNGFRSSLTDSTVVDGRDLLSLAIHEIGHVMGFSEVLYDQALAGNAFSTPSGNATITDTLISNDLTSATDDTYWIFEGPSINAVLTNFDIGGTASNGRHAARALSGNQPISFDGNDYFGSRDVMNGTSITSGGRALISNKTALILQDAYGYTINLPEEIATMYAVFDQTSGTITVRGGGDDTVIDNVCQGGSFDTDGNCDGADDDVISITRDGNDIVVSVDVGNDVPGTGPGMTPEDQQDAFVTRFSTTSNAITQIVVNAGDGHDSITVGEGIGVPVIVNGGEGDDTLFPLFTSAATDLELHFTGGTGVDRVQYALDSHVTVSSLGLCLTDSGSCPGGVIEFHDVIDEMRIIGGPSANTFILDSYTGTPILSGEGGNDSMTIGHEDGFLEGGPGNDTFRVGLGNNSYSGGTGHDRLFVEGTFGADTYISDINGTGLEEASYQFLDGQDDFTLFAPVGISVYVSGGPDNDRLDMSGSHSPVEAHGGLGNDTITGSPQSDELFGEGNADIIFGGTGNDNINGGTGPDSLFGEDDEDELIGGDGPDLLVGGMDSDTLFGDDGNDLLIGGIEVATDSRIFDRSDDRLSGGPGNDKMAGDNAIANRPNLTPTVIEGGRDDIRGDQGNDLIYGQGGNDNIQGNEGSDTLLG